MNNALYTMEEIENFAAVANATRTFTSANAQTLMYETGPCYRSIEYTFTLDNGMYRLTNKRAK